VPTRSAEELARDVKALSEQVRFAVDTPPVWNVAIDDSADAVMSVFDGDGTQPIAQRLHDAEARIELARQTFDQARLTSAADEVGRSHIAPRIFELLLAIREGKTKP